MDNMSFKTFLPATDDPTFTNHAADQEETIELMPTFNAMVARSQSDNAENISAIGLIEREKEEETIRQRAIQKDSQPRATRSSKIQFYLLLALFLLACLLFERKFNTMTLRGALKNGGCPPGSFVSDDSSCTPCAVDTVSASFDSPNCTPCPTGLIQNQDRTECGCPSGKILNSNGGCDPHDAPPPTTSSTPCPTKAPLSSSPSKAPVSSSLSKSPSSKANCNGKDDQCGGIGYTGETCCRTGFSCVEDNALWSACRVNAASGGCATLWGQCGGANWNGPTCCIDGFTCIAESQWYSHCLEPSSPGANLPSPPEPPFSSANNNAICKGKYEQCGGIGYTGETCCKSGYTCVKDTAGWSSCKVNPASRGCATLSGQCGGANWNGPTCCIDGFTCIAESQWYSHCLEPSDPRANLPTPSPEEAPVSSPKMAICKGRDEQCGGIGHTGETCCRSGYTCVKDTAGWSSCKVNPASGGCATLSGQCGGTNWKGPTCCIDGFTCVAQGQWFSQCRDPHDLA